MNEISELNDFYVNKGVKESDLKKIALYIHNYAKIMFKHYNISITESELEDASIKLYHTLLYQAKSIGEDTNKEAEDILYKTLDDFESGTVEDGYDNMIFLVGKSGTEEKLRQEKITELGIMISEDQGL